MSGSHTAGKEERALSGPQEPPRARLPPRPPSLAEPLVQMKERSKRWSGPPGPPGALRAAPGRSRPRPASDGREAGPSLSDASREVRPSAASVGRVTDGGTEPRWETKLETCVSRVGRARYSSSLSSSSSDFHPDSAWAGGQTPGPAPFSLSVQGRASLCPTSSAHAACPQGASPSQPSGLALHSPKEHPYCPGLWGWTRAGYKRPTPRGSASAVFQRAAV